MLASQERAGLLLPVMGLRECCLCARNDLVGSGALLVGVGSECIGVDTVEIAVHDSREDGAFLLDQQR